ncbi:hypothetical protein PIB30_055710 [Stylosanthes scabra]|uniref:Uncharacterized protein n=1 Tax=Stylosanthes scabra TaxID=79078 RepID=A0ABU6XKP8_9FABA|nr:hypothetical protein [Stylosanthes scabra]
MADELLDELSTNAATASQRDPEKDDLGLKEELAKDLENMAWRILSSLVESSDTYGRDIDKEVIIEMLLDGTSEL